MVNQGYIKLHRKIWKSDLWKLNDATFKLAIHCLLKANGKEKEWFDERSKTYTLLKRGEFISSTRHLAKELGHSIGRTQKRLENLSTIGFLSRKAERSFSRFIIVKYNEYNPQAIRKAEQKAERYPIRKAESTNKDSKEDNYKDSNTNSLLIKNKNQVKGKGKKILSPSKTEELIRTPLEQASLNKTLAKMKKTMFKKMPTE